MLEKTRGYNIEIVHMRGMRNKFADFGVDVQNIAVEGAECEEYQAELARTSEMCLVPTLCEP